MINIITKKGKLGKHQDIKVRGGQENTQDIFYSISGADEKTNYYVGLNYYATDGISAMNNDHENDPYNTNSLTANFDYNFSKNNTIENSFRLKDSYLKYDEVTNGRDDTKNSTDNVEAQYNFKFINTNDRFKNTFGYI